MQNRICREMFSSRCNNMCLLHMSLLLQLTQRAKNANTDTQSCMRKSVNRKITIESLLMEVLSIDENLALCPVAHHPLVADGKLQGVAREVAFDHMCFIPHRAERIR